uniref:Putative secreted protein n=1 Tax=Anopheles darlingi TaxID=43151 RepID=A0A2M4DMU6_ANODA
MKFNPLASCALCQLIMQSCGAHDVTPIIPTRTFSMISAKSKRYGVVLCMHIPGAHLPLSNTSLFAAAAMR